MRLMTSDPNFLCELNLEMTATVTRNPNLVLIARQFVWMELFTQRIYARLGQDLLDRLDPTDRQILPV